MPETTLMKVDFPAPLGPIIDMMLLFSKEKAPSSPALMPPKCLLKPRTSSRTLSSGRFSKNLSPLVKKPAHPACQPAGHENKDHDDQYPEENRIDFTRHSGQKPTKVHMNQLSHPHNDKGPEQRAVDRFTPSYDDHRDEFHEEGKPEDSGLREPEIKGVNAAGQAGHYRRQNKDLQFVPGHVDTHAPRRYLAVAECLDRPAHPGAHQVVEKPESS